jgi:hypothetical protein
MLTVHIQKLKNLFRLEKKKKILKTIFHHQLFREAIDVDTETSFKFGKLKGGTGVTEHDLLESKF